MTKFHPSVADYPAHHPNVADYPAVAGVAGVAGVAEYLSRRRWLLLRVGLRRLGTEGDLMGMLVIAMCALAIVAWCGCVVVSDRSMAAGLLTFVLGLSLLVGAAQLAGPDERTDEARASGQAP